MIIINTSGNAGLDDTDKDWIRTMATGCPKDDGPAVYMARNMLNSIDGVIYDYFYSCGETEERKMNTEPASACIVSNRGIAILGSEHTGCTLNVYDITGKFMYSEKITEKRSYELRVANGAYIFDIVNRYGTGVEKGKIFIVK